MANAGLAGLAGVAGLAGLAVVAGFVGLAAGPSVCGEQTLLGLFQLIDSTGEPMSHIASASAPG